MKAIYRLTQKDVDVSERMLNASLPWHLHIASIKRLFLPCPKVSLFKVGFILRCVQYLSHIA